MSGWSTSATSSIRLNNGRGNEDAAVASESSDMDTIRTLNARQQSIIPIAAFTANGDLANLKTSLSEGLEAGLTVNEIKEILIQMYAYAGFPRCLNSIGTFMAVMDERQAAGIVDNPGSEASPVPADLNKDQYGAQVRAKLAGPEAIHPGTGYELFTPVIDTFLKEHLFADIFARDVLDHQSRELAIISALASMSGTDSQLYFHFGAAMNTGLSEAQMHTFIDVLKAKVGQQEAEDAANVLDQFLRNKTS